MKQWILSDTHFGHKNILIYEPYRLRLVCEEIAKSKRVITDEIVDRAEYVEMLAERYKMAVETDNLEIIDEYLKIHDSIVTKLYNKDIKKDDIVYFLGDLTLTRKIDQIKAITESLNGRKIMIMGNHDTRKPEAYINAGFDQVTKRPIILPRNGMNVILMHEPPYDPELETDLYEEDENGNLIDSHDHQVSNPIMWNPYDYFLFGHVHSDKCPVEVHQNVKCICIDRNELHPYELEKVIKELREANNDKKI